MRSGRLFVFRVIALLGLLTGEVGGAAMHAPPFYPQQVLRTGAGGAAMVLLALATVGALIAATRPPASPETRAWRAAVLASGALAFAVNLLAPAAGLWTGPVFAAPVAPLALLTGLRAMFLLGLLLLFYRGLAYKLTWVAQLWDPLESTCRHASLSIL